MPPDWPVVSDRLFNDSDSQVVRLSRRLAVRFGDLRALNSAIAVAIDPNKPQMERIDAIRDLAATGANEALKPLLDLLKNDKGNELRSEICRGLAQYDKPEIARIVLSGWEHYPPVLRTEVINLLSGRKSWAEDLLAAVGRKDLQRTELNDNTVERIRALRDKRLNRQIEDVWGRVREATPAELSALINRMRAGLADAPGSSDRGKRVFENQCAKCHRFEGSGHNVGPNLDGAARDLEYLLVNILDPNRVVGQPYYTRFVTLKNGRVETGILASEDDQSITLKMENDARKTISRNTIQEMVVQEKSLMPEGLAGLMSVQDFRDLVRYLMSNPFLTDVAVAGPFAEDHRPAPDWNHPLRTPGVTWSWPAVGVSGGIPLKGRSNEGQVTSFVTAEVVATEPMRTQLLLSAANPLEVWLNGKRVHAGQGVTGPAAPDQVSLEVKLSQGINRVVFAIHHRGKESRFYARFVDRARLLRYSKGGDTP
jgi:putative heme-binding domain-containing protein